MKNIAMLIALIPTVFKIAIQKQLEAEQVALVLIAGVFFVAGGKPFIKLIASIVGLYLFSQEITGGVGQEVVFALLLQLGIMLVGIYIMIKGLFPQK